MHIRMALDVIFNEKNIEQLFWHPSPPDCVHVRCKHELAFPYNFNIVTLDRGDLALLLCEKDSYPLSSLKQKKEISYQI